MNDPVAPFTRYVPSCELRFVVDLSIIADKGECRINRFSMI